MDVIDPHSARLTLTLERGLYDPQQATDGVLQTHVPGTMYGRPQPSAGRAASEERPVAELRLPKSNSFSPATLPTPT